MKTKLFTFVLIAATFAACRENTTKNETANAGKKPVTAITGETADKPYKTAPPMYLAGSNIAEAGAVAAKGTETGLFPKQTDPAYDWKYFDNAYTAISNPRPAEKQYFGYVVLAQKDLIGEPAAATTDAVKKKYITNLVNTSYKGYCLLYYALQSLSPIKENALFIGTAKNRIIVDYEKDPSIKSFMTLDLDQVKSEKQKIEFQKVKQNYAYIENIRAL
jgi:hypothetical protein